MKALESFKGIIRPYYRKYKAIKDERAFRRRISNLKNEPMNIVVGSSGVFEKGWIPSEEHFLDLLDDETWYNYFKEDSINGILAEHVWEHIDINQGKKAAENCYKFLKKGGRLRVAVPDGFHKDEEYIEKVKPGGHGAGSDDHKVLYTYKTFSSIFEENGFEVELVEYFDENKVFNSNQWDEKDGYIHRSINNDKRNIDGKPHYTSLIIDAIKK